MPLDLTLNIAAPASLADYTRPALLVPQLRARDTAGIINELSQVLQREGCVPDVLPFYHAALNQELLANSALECGIAFPHARLGGIKELRFAFGRVPQPLMWGPKGSWPAQLIFLLAVPATDAVRYLNLLSSLARLGTQPSLVQELRMANDGASILALLKKIRLRQG